MLSCDVVVIGAGLGGLSAAVRLAQRGCKVVVVEQHDQVGGYASSFQRGDYRFEVSLHLIDALGPHDPNRWILDALAIGDQLELCQPSDLRCEHWPDRQLRIPWQMPRLLDALGEQFPNQRGGLAQIANLASRAHSQFVAQNQARPAPMPSPLLAELSRRTIGPILDDHLDDGRLRASFDLFARGWLGLPLDKLAAAHFLICWYSYHHYGGYYPIGGSARLAELLAHQLVRHGGQLLLGERVRGIDVQRRRAAGVVLKGDRRIAAKAVVSNAEPRATLAALSDPSGVPLRYQRRLAATPDSVSCVKLWLALRDSDVIDGWRDYDSYLTHYPLSNGSTDPSQQPVSLVVPRALDRRLETSERATLSISTVVSTAAWHKACANGDTSRLRETWLRRAESVLPGLRAAIAVSELATPATFARFTLNPGGSIYGASPLVGWCGGSRSGARTPVNGLYLAGAWTRPGAGVSAVLQSGIRAAEAVANQLERASAHAPTRVDPC